LDPIWLSIAFVLGFAVRTVKLPPLVGYLLAGFLLNALGAESGEFIEVVSDLGVTLLLFTIGLKIKVKDLLQPEIWGGAGVQMLSTSLALGVLVLLLSFTGFSLFAHIDWKISLLLAFTLSFSSTVFAVKVLEETGKTNSLFGKTSIGILIMQDLVAVLFLVLAAGKIPNWYAILIPVALFAIRPLLFKILDKIGHGELLILYGFFLALIPGAELFKFVGLKADLGALIIGMILSNHTKGKELANSLLSFKDFFLIGFFLSIGFSGIPTFEHIIIAFILALLINFKVLLFFFTFIKFRLRARTSVLSSLSLANYSEFGLILIALSVSKGWLEEDWMVIVAIALSITFVISSPLNSYALPIYNILKKHLLPFETKERLIYDRTIDIRDAEILIFGMGLLGTATYDQLFKQYDQKVLALDFNREKVLKHTQAGRNVVHDDATDSEFWEQVMSKKPAKQVKLVMLCMDDHHSNMDTIARLKSVNFKGMIAATAPFDDEVKELKEHGVHLAYNLYTEAGVGFADLVCDNLESCGL
jgi:glutathione-regulated potassium-efflux system ancillary protein KefC